MEPTSLAVLALYPPIILFACWVVWLYGCNVLWPAYKMGQLRIQQHALPIAVVLASSADLIENIWYGLSRIIPGGYVSFGMFMGAVGPMKIVILVGAIFAVAGYKRAVDGDTSIVQLFLGAAALWLGSFSLLSWVM